jgi:hypothetical protein
VSNLSAYGQFRRALRQPQKVQRHKLRDLLARNAHTAFGHAHGFDQIHSYADLVRRVPLADYNQLEPWIARVRQGEENTLTSEKVTHLLPTSGSSSARKLIPFTASLQREFQAALGAWLVDLQRQAPGLIGGPAYWSITPVIHGEIPEESIVPIGFDTDAAYLGGARRKLAEKVLAVPASVGCAKSLETFRYATLLHLLRARDLRLISVWHPSFLTLLLDTLSTHWPRLLSDMEQGTASTEPLPRRAAELRRADPHTPETCWPELRVISCWGEGAAALALASLRERFPHVMVQPKGLLATEAFVTLPFRGQYPLAVHSHFFEFLDPEGKVLTVEALRRGVEYEVIVTTSGGLWRYRLGDRVWVTGWMEQTPTLQFLGRGENVSDHCGEKLAEPFVASVLSELFGNELPRFALLAPDEEDMACGYTLYVEGVTQSYWPDALDRALRRNPHYAYCRDLSQLSPVRVFVISERGFETFAQRCAGNGARLGGIKPTALSRASGWSKFFAGAYLQPGARAESTRA